MEDYISKFHREEIKSILETSNPFISINFDLTNLSNENPNLFELIKLKFDEEYAKWKKAAISQITDIVQNEKIQLPKQNMQIEFQFSNHPNKIIWPRLTMDLYQLIEFKGYVFRQSNPRKLELLREVKCIKCKLTTIIKADRQYDYAFKCSQTCIITKDCGGKMSYTKKEEEIPPMENTIDFQIFKVQELDKYTPKNRFYFVEVEGKLVDSCTIGDTVQILGTLETRNDLHTKEIKRIVMRAISINKAFEFKNSINSKEKEAVYNEWISDKKRHNNDELEARDEMLKAVAPELSRCFTLKLALLIVLCTGGRAKAIKTRSQRLERMTNRDISHLLFIGLPGLGKSQLLKAVAKISSRSVKCVGSSCSMAGLTASSYKEDKETHIEAGALVLANHGICNIDEFNLLSTKTRAVLHDAMEHQKFSFMQANLKCEINSRCSVIGSMNHKAEQMAESRNRSIKNATFNIEPSLISRFDFVFFLEKPEDPEFDENIIDTIIDEAIIDYQEPAAEWCFERLQLHVIVAKNLACEFTPEVLNLLFHYYEFCRACEGVDESRKTMRLMKSLERLTIGHAKLMLRKKTKLIDALTIIWLMENTWSFGDLIAQSNAILSELPLGPSSQCIRHIFETLQLTNLHEVYEKEQREILNDECPNGFNESIKEAVNEKKEPKKLFNKTVGIKRRSNERNNSEKSNVDEELPEVLRKSFAIDNIDDLFADSDEETNGKIDFTGSPKIQYTETENMLSIEHMEDYLFNQNTNEINDTINNFEVPTENMSTQQEQLSNQAAQSPKTNNIHKPSISNLLLRKSKDSCLNDQADIRKLLSDEDIFSLPKYDNAEISSKTAEIKPILENSTIKKKPSVSLGFFSRLKNFEYSSQQSQKTQLHANNTNNDKSKADTSAIISENLLALSSMLTGNDENHQNSNNKKFRSTPMTNEEYQKALDAELDIWN